MIRRSVATFSIVVLLSAVAAAQPNLSVDIHIPTITVNTSTQQYEPMPIPVHVTIHNTGTMASLPLSARITFPPILELDASEMHQTIKQPVPVAVAPNDSATVKWMLFHPPSFNPKNYRVSVWVKTSPTDSFVTNKLFILPAMSRADLAVTISPMPDLQVRPDSLGYTDNPFKLHTRMMNNGGTQADSVRVHLQLPPGYTLDPPTQENPIRILPPVPGAGSATQRYEYDFWIRYHGATRQQRVDTFLVYATGVDLAGDTTRGDTTATLLVHGMSPPYALTLTSQPSLAYDVDSVYAPNPFPVRVRVENVGEQVAVLSRLQVQDMGEGISTQDPQSLQLPTLLPGEHFEHSLSFRAERRDADRSVQFTAIVTDLDNNTKVDDATTQIPGKPYGISLVNAQLPDTLRTNAAGTDYLLNPFPVSADVRSDSWYVSTVTHARLAGPSVDILPPVVRDYSPALPLLPGAVATAVSDTVEVIGSTVDRVLTFRFSALTDRGDTATLSHTMVVPGLLPVAAISRAGVDSLRYNPIRSYTPNPFFQSVSLRNAGHIPFRIDSVLIRFDMDGLTPAEPLRQDFGWGIAPGDSVTARWNLSAYAREYDRTVRFMATAYYEGRFFEDIEFEVFIPGLYPKLDAILTGADTLVYDPVTTYRPNPFTKHLQLRNAGTADMTLDSVVFSFSDPLVQAMDPLRHDFGGTIRPDSGLDIAWRFTVLLRNTEVTLPMTVTVYHDSGSAALQTFVYIPALIPGMSASVDGPDSLSFDTDLVYAPHPFKRVVEVQNTGNTPLQLDSIHLSSFGAGLTTSSSLNRVLANTLVPGALQRVTWWFEAERRQQPVLLPFTFVLYHSGGQALTLGSEIFVPGQQFAFRITDVTVPDTLHLSASRGDYERNPFLTRFTPFNDSWVQISRWRTVMWVEGEGVTPLTPLDRDHGGSIAPWSAAAVRSDSFRVQARSIERTLRLHMQVYDDFGAGDSAVYHVHVPAVEVTSVKNSSTPQHFAIASVYPNPISGTSGTLTVAYTLERASAVHIDILDLLGRTVASHTDAHAQPGRRRAMVALPPLPTGMYMLRLRNTVQTAAVRLSVIR